MAKKPKFDTSFAFGANVRAKKGKAKQKRSQASRARSKAAGYGS